MSDKFRNVGSLDSAIRVTVGILLLLVTVVGPKTYWGLLGVIPLLTGIIGFCPLYRVLGLSSCPRTPHAG